MVRADSVDAAINLINSNPYGNGTAIFTSSGEAARTFQRGVNVGMIGINVPIPVPMAYYSFGGWKDSLFGQSHIHGPEGVAFYTRAKVVTSRWPHVEGAAAPASTSPRRTDAGSDDHVSIACTTSGSLLTCSCSLLAERRGGHGPPAPGAGQHSPICPQFPAPQGHHPAGHRSPPPGRLPGERKDR